MQIECEVLHWTAMGMRASGGIGDYIDKRTVERLLTEADERRRVQDRERIADLEREVERLTDQLNASHYGWYQR